MSRVLGPRLLVGQHAYDCCLNGWRRARPLKPNKVRLFSEPDQLPSSVTAVLLREHGARRRLVRHPGQRLEGLAVDQAAKRPGALGHASREEPANLIEQARFKLRVD